MDTCLRCPHCHAPLFRADGVFRCAAGHSFDRARQGYVNLLVGHAAGQHGDNAEMIRARRDFLNGGYYRPLRDAVAQTAAAYFPAGGTLLDAGCGECYYTDAVMAALSERGARGYGIDISREAIRAGCARGAVRNGALSLFVAGVYDMPFADRSMDMVLNMFAPLATGEYLRILAPNGIFLLAIPAEKHLWELKELLYETPRENEVQDFALPGFDLLESRAITYPFDLVGKTAVANLFSMTPYRYRSPAAGRARLAETERLRVTASFYLLAYRRKTEARVP